MQIRCNKCGATQLFKYSEKNVNSLIAFGWSSYGGKLYCPVCVVNRKGEPDGIAATAAVIDSIAERLGVINGTQKFSCKNR